VIPADSDEYDSEQDDDEPVKGIQTNTSIFDTGY